MKNNIYLIQAIETEKQKVGWDEYRGHVIAAQSEENALKLSEILIPVEITLIGKELKVEPEGIILSDFNQG